jgi:hypothetical protein
VAVAAKGSGRAASDAREVYDRLLPYVRRPGALGDINPASGGASGMQLYSQLLVRLADPAAEVPSRSFVAAARLPSVAGSLALSRPAHALWHSLWVLPAIVPMGLGTWISFGYIGIRDHRRQWLLFGAIYFALMVAGIVLTTTVPNTWPLPVTATAGLIIVMAIWAGGFLHAVWVNFAVRLPLLAKADPTRKR